VARTNQHEWGGWLGEYFAKTYISHEAERAAAKSHKTRPTRSRN
jgi:hypothetical protein